METSHIERLEFLRRNTILGPIALIKLANFKRDVAKESQTYYLREGDMADDNFSLVDQYEYDLRFRYWSYDCANLWRSYADGLGLDEFALKVMDGQIAREKLREIKKTKKYKK